MFGRSKGQPRRGISDEEFSALGRKPVDSWRDSGPFDIAEVDLDDGVDRLDWGSLIITPWPGLVVEPFTMPSGEVASLLLHWQDMTVELTLFADAASGELSQKMVGLLAEHAESLGGHSGEFTSPLGLAMTLVVPADGDPEMRFERIKLWFVQGPNWLLRVSFVGNSVNLEPDDPRMQRWLAGIRAVCVNRGVAAMIPGSLVPLLGAGTVE